MQKPKAWLETKINIVSLLKDFHKNLKRLSEFFKVDYNGQLCPVL